MTVFAAKGRTQSVNFLALLIALMVLLLAQTLVGRDDGKVAAAVLNLMFVGTLITTAYALSGPRWARMVTFASGTVAAVSGWMVFIGGPLVVGVLFASYLVFFALVCGNVLMRVFDDGRVDANKLYAVCCAYLLAGLSWSMLYALTELIAPGSFRVPEEGGDAFSQLVYFSLVTLTTLGYDDITPVSGFARMSASIEAIFGQAYMAVLVARLVGLRPKAALGETPDVDPAP